MFVKMHVCAADTGAVSVREPRLTSCAAAVVYEYGDLQYLCAAPLHQWRYSKA